MSSTSQGVGIKWTRGQTAEHTLRKHRNRRRLVTGSPSVSGDIRFAHKASRRCRHANHTNDGSQTDWGKPHE